MTFSPTPQHQQPNHTQNAALCWQYEAIFETSLPGKFGEVSTVRQPIVSGGKRAVLGTGTHPAINYLTLGKPAYSAKAAGRGGARNHGNKVSHALTRAQISNLRGAERHSRAIGLPFTRMITIHWQNAGVTLADMARATGRYLDRLTKAFARHGSRTAWLWVMENGHDKGWHCHILIHVPAELVAVVTALQKRWLRQITCKAYCARVIKGRPIGKRINTYRSDPVDHAINLEIAFGYVCKGAPQEILDAFGISHEHQPGGKIVGRRCSTSQNIGRKAREAGG